MLGLQRKMNTAGDLQAVVRTMKAMAATSISQYENAVLSLEDYYRTVELGLCAYFKNAYIRSGTKSDILLNSHKMNKVKSPTEKESVAVIVFGSDQGLVGQFNDVLVSFLRDKLPKISGNKLLWTVGERMQARLVETSFSIGRNFALPNSIDSITALVAEVLVEIESQQKLANIKQVYLFYNSSSSNSRYAPVCHRLLPLDKHWQHTLTSQSWPTARLPQMLCDGNKTLTALISEYLFVSIFQACTKSLASENASRLMAMQRAEKNIEELQNQLQRTYHHQRQSSIDEELFDLVGGFEALTDVN
jgi:F-type H+-transporting ATPase subunit gamma